MPLPHVRATLRCSFNTSLEEYSGNFNKLKLKKKKGGGGGGGERRENGNKCMQNLCSKT